MATLIILFNNIAIEYKLHAFSGLPDGRNYTMSNR